MDIRCVNCTINFDNVNYTSLTHISNSLIRKLELWVKHSIILANYTNAYICEPCLVNLTLKTERLPLNRNICVGCGTPVPKDSFVLTGDDLQVCRSWTPVEIAVDHLDKVCHSCNSRLKNSKTCNLDNEETEIKETCFVGVEVIETEDALEDNADIKSEPESIDICYDSLKDENDPTNDQNINENDQNQDENEVSCENDQISSEEEQVLISSIKSEHNYISYEFLEEPPEEATENSTIINILETSEKRNKSSTHKISNRNKNDSDDEDYIPPPSLRIHSVKTGTTENHTKVTTTTEYEPELMIELEKYKRTTRIGLCIFNDCIKDCFRLVPQIVRREMVIEHKIYIPLLSKVCQEHYQDQNWEDLAFGCTTKLFTADHCQDMINIVKEACHTNFDFENIETVDSKLVRYWFDLNKRDFNRIFRRFRQLKRLREPKTAFAIYLMHLQKASVKRIALLLKKDRDEVKKRIAFVKDIVKCDTFKMFKKRFLKDDDEDI